MTDRPRWWQHPSVHFVTLFLLLVLGLNLVIAARWVDQNIVFPYTRFIAGTSAALLDLMGQSISQSGTVMSSETFAVDIRRGCDGIVATVLLVSACIAFPSPWRQKLIGTLIGYCLIFALNLGRIVVLFLLGQNGAMTMFDFVHTYVAQFAVIALTMVFWIFWAGRQRPLYQ